MKIISDISLVDKKKWSEFVLNHPNGNFFQTPVGYDFLGNFGHGVLFIVINDKNEILGVLIGYIEGFGPLIVKRLFRRIVVIGGPLILNDNAQICYKLINCLIKAYQTQIFYIEIRNINSKTNVFDLNQFGFIHKPYLNIINKLQFSENEIFKRFSSSRKKGIRKAEKLGFRVVPKEILTGEEIRDFYSLIKKFHDRKGIPYPSFNFFYNNNKPNFIGSVLYFILYDSLGEIKGILQVLTYNKIMYGHIIGYLPDPEFLKRKPLDLLYWEVFKFANKSGFHEFNWMGAGQPFKKYGVREFKMQYGGDLTEANRKIKILRPVHYFLFRWVLTNMYSFIKKILLV